MAVSVSMIKAHAYYAIAVKQLFGKGSRRFVTTSSAFSEFRNAYFDNLPDDFDTSRIAQLFYEILNEVENYDGCEIIRDDYAESFVRFNKEQMIAIYQEDKFNDVYSKYHRLGDAGDKWLTSAMVSISLNLSSEEISDYFLPVENFEVGDTGKITSDEMESDAVVWIPMQIDRDNADYKAAVNASEKALQEIEASNEYAASQPDEREGLIATVRGSLDALKRGTPSRKSLIEGLLRPLEFASKKFAGLMMGESAKFAVQSLLKWFSGL